MCLIMKEDCIFCKIAKGEIHSATVYEDSHFTVILDVNPATKGHCLIIPKEHFDNIYDLDGETAGKLFALATCIARAMRDALKCDGLNLVQNNGEIAGQPPVKACLKEDGQVVCLIKPQFEAGREKVGKKGVVRDRQVHEDVIKQIMDFALALGFSLLHLDYSPIKGPEGNIEYLLHLLNRPEESQISDEMIPDVVAASHQSLSHREAAK